MTNELFAKNLKISNNAELMAEYDSVMALVPHVSSKSIWKQRGELVTKEMTKRGLLAINK